MNRSRLLLLMLVLVLTFPVGVLTTKESVEPRTPTSAGFAAPQHLEPFETEPVLSARKQGNRKETRREDRKADQPHPG